MPVCIQKFLINIILPPFIKLRSKIDDLGADMLFIVSMAGILIMQYLNHANLMGARFIYMFVPFCFFTGLMIISGLGENMQPVKFRTSAILLWWITGLFALITGVLICSDYFADVIIMLIVMPVFYMVWAPKKEHLFDLSCTAIQISYTVLILFNMFFFRVTTNYEGCFINPNRLSMVSAVAFSASIARFMMPERKKSERIISGIFAAGAFGIVLLTESRAGVFVIGVCAVTAICIELIKQKQDTNRCDFKVIIPFAIALCLAAFITKPVFDAAYRLTDIVADPETVEVAIWDKQPQHYTQCIIKDDQSTDDDPNSGEENEYEVELYSYADGTLMNGRKEIWKAYFDSLGFLGHSTDEHTPYVYNGADYKAHNTPLQMAYSYGFPAGIFYLIFNILSGLIALEIAIENRSKKGSCAMFPLTAAIGFCAYSMIESLVSPVNQTLTLLYFISLTGIVIKPSEADKSTMINSN